MDTMTAENTSATSAQTPLPVPEQPLPFSLNDWKDIKADKQGTAECSDWLGFHRVWGQLSAEALQAIAHSLQTFRVEPQTLIYQEGQTPIGLYLIKWGTVEIFRQSPIGPSLIRYRNAGDLFG